ncbi:MAG: prepilin-type N-terminal cleavage/methylation protein [Candidatus Saccharibacteria bacterium]|nr:prepilin-type N-terminal cleavage/methylation protein [Candidatus Saccharibacteria bacterium]
MKHRHQSGFTIVELLIVIVVIGILAAITIVAYNGIQDRARVSSVSSALSQAAKKISVWQVDNPNTSPPDLSAVGVTNSSDVSYQYTAGTNGVYCITATAGITSYKITESTKPTAGGCAGHGVGGVGAVTNYAVNPSYETTTATTALYNGATVTRQLVAYADSGSYVARITKGTAGSTLTFMIYPIPWTANSSISARFKVRLSPGTTATNTLTPTIQAYQSGSGVGAATGCSVQTPNPLSASSWSDVILQGCTTPNVTMNSIGVMVVPGQLWAATDGVEIDSIMITNGSTIGTFGYGDSPNWVWNGTINGSTSTGPPL